ncbi:CRE-DAO-3 protein [Aphelenchoides avenae]|nr:CRE-DAO-3 protein [Aphelenchus avenae]
MLVRRDPNYVKGKNVVVLGRSRIVGPPAAALFMWQQGTTTIGDSKSENLKELCQKADILIVGLGEEHVIKGGWIKPGAVVIDCGINVKVFEEGKVQHGGDVDFEEAVKVAGYITPAPGGVGPMTVAMLMKNTLKQAIERGIQVSSSSRITDEPLV